MNYFPVMLDLHNKNVVVIGGGKVAYRKTKELLRCTKKIKVISNKFIPEFYKLNVKLIKRRFKHADTKDAFLIFACADRKTNRRVFLSAGDKLVNCVDEPDISNFISPAVIRRGRILLAISTGGSSPYLARVLRVMFSKHIGKAAKISEELFKMRKEILKLPLEERRRFLEKFIGGRL